MMSIQQIIIGFLTGTAIANVGPNRKCKKINNPSLPVGNPPNVDPIFPVSYKFVPKQNVPDSAKVFSPLPSPVDGAIEGTSGCTEGSCSGEDIDPQQNIPVVFKPTYLPQNEPGTSSTAPPTKPVQQSNPGVTQKVPPMFEKSYGKSRTNSPSPTMPVQQPKPVQKPVLQQPEPVDKQSNPEKDPKIVICPGTNTEGPCPPQFTPSYGNGQTKVNNPNIPEKTTEGVDLDPVATIKICPETQSPGPCQPQFIPSYNQPKSNVASPQIQKYRYADPIHHVKTISTTTTTKNGVTNTEQHEFYNQSVNGDHNTGYSTYTTKQGDNPSQVSHLKHYDLSKPELIHHLKNIVKKNPQYYLELIKLNQTIHLPSLLKSIVNDPEINVNGIVYDCIKERFPHIHIEFSYIKTDCENSA